MEVDCGPCADGNEARWRGYMFVMNPRTRNVSILEVTAAPMRRIDTYFREHRTLRGALVDLDRKSGKANGELYIDISEGAIAKENLPNVPSLKLLLCKIWKLDPRTLKEKPAPPTLLTDDDAEFDNDVEHVA